TSPPALHPLSLHDALPISEQAAGRRHQRTLGSSSMALGTRLRSSANSLRWPGCWARTLPVHPMRRVVVSLPAAARRPPVSSDGRSEEHTSELQSPYDLVCR